MPVVPQFYVLIAGYPSLPGNMVAIEVRNAAGELARFPIRKDAGAKWMLRSISVPNAAQWQSFRLVGADAASGPRAWVGFSEPFLLKPGVWPQLADPDPFWPLFRKARGAGPRRI